MCEECGDTDATYPTDDGRRLCVDCLEETGYTGDVAIA